jgi:MFS family permease
LLVAGRWVALAVVCAGSLMNVLDTTIVGVALPAIRLDLGFSQESLAWVVNAYLLTYGGFLLPGGGWGTCSGSGGCSSPGSACSRRRRWRVRWPAGRGG